MKTSLLTLSSSFIVVLGLASCVPLDPYYDGGGYSSGGGYGYGSGGYGGSSYGSSYGGGYSPRPYSRPYGSSYGSSRYDHHDHDDHDDHDDNRRSSNSRSSREKNDTLYRYRGKNGPEGNHTIDWWHSRGYQRSQLDFAR